MEDRKKFDEALERPNSPSEVGQEVIDKEMELFRQGMASLGALPGGGR